MMFSEPYDTLFNLQRTLDTFMRSNWLESTLSGGGAYPPINVFRKARISCLLLSYRGWKSRVSTSR
jgi:hypothetical protein